MKLVADEGTIDGSASYYISNFSLNTGMYLERKPSTNA